MPKKVKNPVVVAEVPQQTYDEIWIPFLQVTATNPNSPVRAVAELKKVGTVEGKKKFAPAEPGAKVYTKLVIPDLYGLAATEPALAAAITSLIDAVTDYAEKIGEL